MTSRYVALLRGVNVGRAKRIAMADLRALVEGLGYVDVQTLLNSGNVVFSSASRTRGEPGKLGTRIEKALASELGLAARVTVLTAAELAAIVGENPLLEIADDPSRLLVAVLQDPRDRSRLAPLEKQRWGDEVLAVGARAAYLWCPEGLLASKLPAALDRALGDAVTSRNWATIGKLAGLATHEGQASKRVPRRAPSARARRGVTPADVRRIALALPEATEADHHGFPSFRVAQRIFATLPDDLRVHVMLDAEETDVAIRSAPAACAELWWGKKLAGVRVTLVAAGTELVAELLTAAWRRKAPAKLVRAFDARRT